METDLVVRLVWLVVGMALGYLIGVTRTILGEIRNMRVEVRDIRVNLSGRR